MSKIKEIHGSHLFGKIIETGCSVPVAYKLGLVAGASKTILYTQQPYNKAYEAELYGEFSRSVSKEFIESVLNREGERENINFVLASSWQLCDETNPLQYAHGWFGLFDKTNKVKHYLHFTFNRGKSSFNQDAGLRERLISWIGDIGVNILHTAIKGDINDLELLNPEYVILDMAYIDNNINYSLLLNSLEKAEGDYFLVFDNHKTIRIEDLVRRGRSLIIQKGSFNPLHHGHIELMNNSVNKHKEAITTFLISTFRYDKPHISAEELVPRIQQINNAGYPLIICKSIYFYETFDNLNKWSYKNDFYFPVGTDTINRIYQTDADYVIKANEKNTGKVGLKADITIRGYINNIIHKFPNCKFLLHNRKGYERIEETNLYDAMLDIIDEYEDDGISSTKIRSGEVENKLKL